MNTLQQLPASSIPERWDIKNPLVAAAISQGVDYKVIGADIGTFSEAIFYHHGLGGSIDDCPEINEFASAKKPIIRVSAYRQSPPATFFNTFTATFGDLCALLHNSRQAVIGIADTLHLSRYQITGHSWGGFVALLAALADRRCKKCMMLGSTPDICDAVTRLGKLVSPGSDTIPWLVRLITPGLSWDAHSAKFGKAIHQEAWNEINPYKPSANPKLKLLIFNREEGEDEVMLKEGVLHFRDFCQNVRIAQTEARFVSAPHCRPHDMCFLLFHKEMERFFNLKAVKK